MRLGPLLLLLISINAIGQSGQGLRFVQNKGQWESDIDFEARVPGGRLGVSVKGFSIQLLDLEEMEKRHLANHQRINESDGLHADEPVDGHYFKINLIGSNTASKPVVDSPLDGYNNYFLGKDASHWATHALAYTSILYPNVYDGIDFRISSLGNNLKYDFVVKPGADPSQIKIEYNGVNNIERAGDELQITTSVGSLAERKPFCYQVAGSNKETVRSEFQLQDNIVSFSLGDYDENRELVIDPLLIFSTYSGSTADNWGSTATPGEHGTLYSAGVTNQNLGGSFPATVGAFQTSNHGNYDMAIIKYESAGTRFLYATHIGGVNNDSPESLVVDKASGDLVVLGVSSSSDYPTGANAFDNTFNFGTMIFNRVMDTYDQWDIVVTRLSPNGDKLVGSTFLGGSGNDGLNLPKQSGGSLVVNYGDEMRGDVITDETGNVYISSVTSSADFPIVNGFDNSFNGGTTDGLVVKLAPDLSSIVWSAYLGGSGLDASYSIKFDSNENIVLAGGTTSNDFPVTAGSYQTTFNGIVDGWVARVAADGSAVLNATFTGTVSFDQVYFVDLNASGNVFVYGQTAGHMPVTSGVYSNVNSGQFLQKFSADLSTVVFSTVFGSGSSNGLVIPNISPTAFLVNDCDNIYMAGWGGSINFSLGYWQSTTDNMPLTSDAYQKTTSGSDFYFIVLNGDATELVYSTYLGGNSSKTHVDGGTSRFDKYGIVYHAVCAGCAALNDTNLATSDFPTTANAKSRLNRSTNCNNAAFKFDLSSLKAMFDTNNLALTMPGFNNVCFPDTIVFENQSIGGRTIVWDFDDGTILNKKNTDPKNVTHQYKQTGHYHVKLKITDLSTCSQTDSIMKIINYFKPDITAGPDAIICDGNSFTLTASGGVTYNWTSSDGTFSSSAQSPTVRPEVATAYYVTVVDGNGCTETDTLNVFVTPLVHASFQTYDVDFSKPGYDNVCYPNPILFKNLSTHGEDFVWNFDDGTIVTKNKSDTVSIIHGYLHEGTYLVKLKATNMNTCNKTDSVTKTIHYFEDHVVVGSDGEICEGTSYQLTASGGSVYKWSADDGAFNSSSPSPIVQPAHSTKYFVTVTDEHSCVKKDTVQVNVLEKVDLKWQHFLKTSCSERATVFVQNETPPEEDVTFQFDFGDGTTSDDTEVEHAYEKDGTYTVKFVAQKKFCPTEATFQVPVYKLLIPNVFTPDGSAGFNDTFEIRLGPDLLAPADAGITVQLVVVDAWGKEVFKSQEYKNDWNASGVAGGVYYFHVKVGDIATCKTWVHVVK